MHINFAGMGERNKTNRTFPPNFAYLIQYGGREEITGDVGRNHKYIFFFHRHYVY